MNLTLRRALAACTLAVAVGAASAAAVQPACAHPLGNFTVNYHTGLTLRTDRIDARIVVDRAEISTAQERPQVDHDGNGTVTPAETRTYARAQCGTVTRQLRVEAGGDSATWQARSSAFAYRPGEAGLRTSRLTCELTAAVDLAHPADVTVRTGYDSRRIGWREITAQGRGVALTASDVPTASATDELRHYPTDPLASPLDQRSATLRTAPGRSAGVVPAALPGAGLLTTALARVSGAFDSLVGARELTFSVGMLALLLAIVLGASHAAMPGHGKTIMAAYLAGRRGTPKDAVVVGATVTLTHTAGVLALGLILPVATGLAGETVLTWLGLASGLLVTAIGGWLLRSAVLSRSTPGHSHSHGHSHGPAHHHHHSQPHPHPSHAHPHPAPARTESDGSVVALLTKDDGHEPHTHPVTGDRHSHTAPAATRGGLIGMGIAGGLVPSPSALVVLLGAVALGRTAFGVLLVLGYGLGMAATLTLAGLLLVRLRERIDRSTRTATSPRWAALTRLAAVGPIATSSLVLLVGIGLTLRAGTGPW
ncbi:nickel/cobalt transporter [Streptomyces sp. NBC_00370]|uniref:nickel/cobalt transporter n=1 Tax=Streptomyces sp. NBC_00370 TaxID=2975728 RepID=UPI002E25B6B8